MAARQQHGRAFSQLPGALHARSYSPCRRRPVDPAAPTATASQPASQPTAQLLSVNNGDWGHTTGAGTTKADNAPGSGVRHVRTTDTDTTHVTPRARGDNLRLTVSVHVSGVAPRVGFLFFCSFFFECLTMSLRRDVRCMLDNSGRVCGVHLARPRGEGGDQRRSNMLV